MKRKDVEKLEDIEFCRIDEDELESTDDYIKFLWSALNHPQCYYSEFSGEFELGEFKRHVDYIGNLKIVINSDEHSPPHFEVRMGNTKACFRIDNGSHFKGEINNGDLRKIQGWYKLKKNQIKLIKMWNDSRPYGCEVGAYRGAMPEED